MVTDDNGCSNADSTVVVNLIPTGIGELADPSFKVYPNPVRNTLLIEWDGGPEKQPESVDLVGVKGEVLLTKAWTNTPSNRLPLDLSGMNPGLYFLRITNEQGRSVHPLVVQP